MDVQECVFWCKPEADNLSLLFLPVYKLAFVPLLSTGFLAR